MPQRHAHTRLSYNDRRGYIERRGDAQLRSRSYMEYQSVQQFTYRYSILHFDDISPLRGRQLLSEEMQAQLAVWGHLVEQELGLEVGWGGRQPFKFLDGRWKFI